MSTDWSSTQASTQNKARGLREFYKKWRTSENAPLAAKSLKKIVERDFDNLDLTSLPRVNEFIKDYPEIHPDVVREAQYKALIEKNSYKSMLEYYKGTADTDRYHVDIGKRIDALVCGEISQAEKEHNVKALQQYAKRYSAWKDSAKVAEAKASAAKVYLERKAAEARARAATAAWTKLKDSRDDDALMSFAHEYSDSCYADLAKKRADALYDDYTFIRQKNTTEAYNTYLRRNPNGYYASEARKRLIDLEVEEVARGDHGKLSAPHRSYNGYGGYGSYAKISLKNSTSYTIEVLYSGSSQSYKRSIPSHETTTLSVTPGNYKVVVKAPGSDVRPFYGENDLAAGDYSEEFYIQTTRNGIPISSPPSSSYPNYNFSRPSYPKTSSPYRRSKY